MEDKLQVITDLENEINADAGLDSVVKAKVLDLIVEVKKDPSDANLEALAVVLETLGDSENFKAAVASLSAIVAKEAVISEEPTVQTL
ncbi:hypothetical protein HYU90_01790 [Candidatus Collierbacteria bacterium]|nr:hypothetical protein [Candidatus Collierbacteria bacterium]